MEQDPQIVAHMARQLDEENWRFRTFLKCYSRISDARLDVIARQIGRRAAAEIDCLNCGACCRDVVVPLETDEITTMAGAAGLAESEFRERYVRRIEGYEHAIDASPCPFQEGARCTVYESRPEVCRGYPYVGLAVRSHSLAILERAGTCPIAFEMMEQLKTRLGFRRWHARNGTRPRCRHSASQEQYAVDEPAPETYGT